MTTAKPASTRKTRANAAATKRAASGSTKTGRRSVEIKIGVQYSPREIVVDVEQDAKDVSKALTEAIEAGGTFNLTDVKGRQVLVPADKITYVEIGEPAKARVGFGAS